MYAERLSINLTVEVKNGGPKDLVQDMALSRSVNKYDEVEIIYTYFPLLKSHVKWGSEFLIQWPAVVLTLGTTVHSFQIFCKLCFFQPLTVRLMQTLVYSCKAQSMFMNDVVGTGLPGAARAER